MRDIAINIKRKLKLVHRALIKINNLILTFIIYFFGIGLSSILWRAKNIFGQPDSGEDLESYWQDHEALDDRLEAYKNLY